MNKSTRMMIAAFAVILFAVTIIAGCGGGGSTGTTTSGGGGGGDDDTGITTSNGKAVSYDCLSQFYNNPSAAFDPSSVENSTSKIVKRVSGEINRQIKSGKETQEINYTETDPYDEDGTCTVTGTYERTDGTNDWTASLTAVYVDWRIFVPVYPDEEFDLNGTIKLTVTYNYTDKVVSAALTYTNYVLSSSNYTYSYDGSISQTGTLNENGAEEVSTSTNMTTTQTEDSETGSLTAALISTIVYDWTSYITTVSGSGSVNYDNYNDTTLTAAYSTSTDFEYDYYGRLTAGKMVIEDSSGNTAVVEVTDTNQITVTVNDEEIYEGTIAEFLGSVVES